jgi:hypothetical protein
MNGFSKLTEVFKKWQYELIIFIIFFVEFISKIPSVGQDETFGLYAYVLSYNLGFIRRAFIGSIVNLISGDFISGEFIWIFVFFSHILLFILAAYLLGQFIKSAEDKTKLFAIGLVALYLASPGSIAALSNAWYWYANGELLPGSDSIYYYLDFYWLLFTLIIVLLLQVKKLYKTQLFLIPLVCFCILATHTMSLFFYIPTIFVLLLYNIYKNNRSKQSIALFIISTLVILVFSVYFSIFAKPNFEYSTVQDVINMLPNNDLYSNGSTPVAIISEFIIGASLQKHRGSALIGPLFRLFSLLLLMLPIIIIGIKLWFSTIKNEKNKLLKNIFILSVLIFIPYIMSFMLFADWGRYLTAIFNCQIILFCYYFHSKEQSVLSASEKVFDFFKRNPFLYFALIIYLLLLGRHNVITSFPFMTKLSYLLGYFF